MTQLPANVRGYIVELLAQIQMLSDRAANLAASLAAVKEQNEMHLARIKGLEDELAKAKARADDPRQSLRSCRRSARSRGDSCAVKGAQ